MSKRDDEIREIHKKYDWVYPMILGGVLVVIGVFIGAWLFGSDEPIASGNMLAYGTNLWTEAISIGITVFILDRINRRRENLATEAKEQEEKLEKEKKEKRKLIFELKSADNATALNALAQIKEAGWADLMFPRADLTKANLENAALAATNLKGTFLGGVNLQLATLMQADMEGAYLMRANLELADLWFANLQRANLVQANLKNAILWNVNLQGTILAGASLQEAKLEEAIFDAKTVLPDAREIGPDNIGQHIYDKYWTPETDMSRYTDPNHPDFWEPQWVKKQNKKPH